VSEDRLEELAARLDGISEELAELAVDVLREAVDAGARGRRRVLTPSGA
jgi:hypothetical protein